MDPRGCLEDSYTTAVTIAVPVLLTIIGVALVVGRKSPVITIAAVFTVVGVWLGQDTWVGDYVMAGLDKISEFTG